MTKFIKEHEKWIKEKLEKGSGSVALKKHLRKTAFLQHERLVHLLIMLFFGLVEIVLVLFVVSMPDVSWLLVGVGGIVGIVEVFYVFHYYLLENTVQRWYEVADKLEEQAGTIQG